jgi:hypothetical protein
MKERIAAMAQIGLKIQQLYEEDYLLWLDETSKQLRTRTIDNLDWEHLIEEIEALGSEQRRKVSSYLRQLLIHLLLYQHWQSERGDCGRGWKGEIRNFRAELDDLLASKTLSNYLRAEMSNVYVKARKIAIDKTDLPSETFPEQCPYTWEQILDSDYLPD